jgi:hypothetical protein
MRVRQRARPTTHDRDERPATERAVVPAMPANPNAEPSPETPRRRISQASRTVAAGNGSDVAYGYERQPL